MKQERLASQGASSRAANPSLRAPPSQPAPSSARAPGRAPSRRPRARRRLHRTVVHPRSRPRGYATSSPAPWPRPPPSSSSPRALRRSTRLFQYGGPRPGDRCGTSAADSEWSEWCRRRDSNPHGFLHTPLKRACLPVPPLRHGRWRRTTILGFGTGGCQQARIFSRPAACPRTAPHDCEDPRHLRDRAGDVIGFR